MSAPPRAALSAACASCARAWGARAARARTVAAGREKRAGGEDGRVGLGGSWVAAKEADGDLASERPREVVATRRQADSQAGRGWRRGRRGRWAVPRISALTNHAKSRQAGDEILLAADGLPRDRHRRASLRDYPPLPWPRTTSPISCRSPLSNTPCTGSTHSTSSTTSTHSHPAPSPPFLPWPNPPSRLTPSPLLPPR